MSKKSLSAVKAKSEELKIPYENLLSAFVIEEAVTAVCESDEAENFRLKNNSILSLEYYRRKAPTRLEYMILSEEELTVRHVIHRMSKIFQNEKKAELWWKYRVEKEDEGICVYLSAKIEELQIPVFGLFGACSTSGEALALAAMTVAAGYGDLVLAATSSHFGSAEKEFRFPLGYANQRPLSSTWTVTGSGAFLVGKKKSRVRISGVTIGKIVDYGLKDSQNMGACMAPAATDTIYRNFQDLGRTQEDYDQVITGDLGYIGQSILFDLMKSRGYDIRKKHMDCGMTIFDQETQDTHAGGSGCGCAASTLASYILPKIENGEWRRILFVPTGALMSTVSFNEGASVPGIAHAIMIEHC